MTASGPFAMGPAMQGASGARRTAPQSNFMPIMPGGPSRGPLGAGLTNTTAPGVGIKREVNDLGVPKKEEGPVDDDGEVYSDPDEGVEIVDMDNVRGMDWMAPESLRKEKIKGKGRERESRKKGDTDVKGKGVAKADVEMAETTPERMESEDAGIDEDSGEAKVNLANALNLSDSEGEEELEDIVHDFASRMDFDADNTYGHEPLYLFQFPSPFPTFVSASASSPEDNVKNKAPGTEQSDGTGKTVSFAPDVKPPAQPKVSNQPPAGQVTESKQEQELLVEGVIGQLEVYASGTVKMRLSNGILLDVTGATQPSFLQHVTYVDPDNKRLCTVGEVYRRFQVSPDVDALLERMEGAGKDQAVGDLGDLDGLIVMDTT
ncbi:RNA polymerase III RPC4-domain-containing protein [Irpex rosettiformis]|uniref:RNA polymerase III RPC4-domain-containing protein n=1 Tax=Irpex rosettiformis TaxID=378272 RepID=A0ACB8UBT3_9APHY|nr:RNA polymerase III RPC4-domain-containing protein [Irpex rosettiformis]